jgi:hypothetical protein
VIIDPLRRNEESDEEEDHWAEPTYVKQPIITQAVPHPSDLAVIKMVGEALQAYPYAPASEPKLTNPAEVQDVIRGLKASKAPGPNGIPNRALKHLPQRAVSLLAAIFNAALLAQYFPSV